MQAIVSQILVNTIKMNMLNDLAEYTVQKVDQMRKSENANKEDAMIRIHGYKIQ